MGNLKRSFTRKEKPKKKRKKRKKLKQNKQSHSLDRENDRAGGQKSSLKELLTTRMADFSTVFIQPKFFCENHTRQKLFYISSYVKFLVKIILMSLKQDLNMDFVPAISLLPIPTSSIISVVQLCSVSPLSPRIYLTFQKNILGAKNCSLYTLLTYIEAV